MSEGQKDLFEFLGSRGGKSRGDKEGAYRRPPTSRKELIARLRELKEIGWIQTRQQFNDGLVGNTLEDFLGIEENNLTLPDAGRYELKAQRMETGSLITLMHFDPFPRRPKSVVTHVLGPIYGWPLEGYEDEWSFRITMYGNRYTNRGFKVTLDEENSKLWVEFNPNEVEPSKKEWLNSVCKKGGKTLTPRPYWPLRKIKERLQRKMFNTVYVHAESRKRRRFEEFKYDKAILYEGLDFKRFNAGLANGEVLIDFDARAGHNHGTKFRVKRGTLTDFYAHKERIF